MSNITINYKNSTIEITKSFEKQASVYGSQAYNELREARAEFPTYRLAIKANKSSSTFNAKAKGVRIGRPQMTRDDIPQIFYRHYPAYLSGDLNVSELARVCELSRNSVYKYIDMLK